MASWLTYQARVGQLLSPWLCPRNESVTAGHTVGSLVRGTFRISPKDVVGKEVGQAVQSGPKRAADVGQPHTKIAAGGGATVTRYCSGKNNEPSTGGSPGSLRRVRSEAAQNRLVGPRMKAGRIVPRVLHPEVAK